MRVVTNIDTSTIRNPLLLAALARGFLRGVVSVNRALMRKLDLPPLYDADVVFKREPWRKGIEEFADALTVFRRGWGDCDDLCPYRVAELQERGCKRWGLPRDPKAGFRLYWRYDERGRPRLYHVQVRHGNGFIEDPSRYLGMPGAGRARRRRRRR